MNKRKYQFTRGRSSRWLPAIQALGCVLALAAVPLCFRYGFDAPEKSEQHNTMTRVRVRPGDAFFRQLELRDPARVFGVPSGGFAADRPERSPRRDYRARAWYAPESPIRPTAYRAAANDPLPVSIDLPTAALPPPLPALTTIVTPRGEVIRSEELTRRTFVPAAGAETRLSLRGTGTLRNCRVIASCGDAAADRAAVRAALASRGGDGVYTVIWRGKAVNR